MHGDDKDEVAGYKVVVNHEEQYSIWPADRDNALGWKDAGKTGPKAECLAHIKEVWTDMRPLSLRKKMEEDARRKKSDKDEKMPDRCTSKDREDESLPIRLSKGNHPVAASLRPEKSVHAFKECVDRGYVHIRFIDTKGGTVLGVRLDRDACDFSKTDFDTQRGAAHIVGGLTLDYVKVRCIAEIDLQRLDGHGHLEIIE
jgi:uncharacterized protein YbdZ (MbtH family)